MKLVLTVLLLGFVSGASWAQTAPWISIDVELNREGEVVGALESQGIPVIAWSNATVDVSDFGGIQQLPVSQLEQQLTEADPRLDPWLAQATGLLRPRENVSRIWIESRFREKALAEAGQNVVAPTTALREVSSEKKPGGRNWVPSPRTVTGWFLVIFAILYAGLLGVTLGFVRKDWPRRPDWIRFGAAGGVFLFGLILILMTFRSSPKVSPERPKTVASAVAWTQHRWFQEAWPFGAKWDDWRPGISWTYPSYQKSGNRVIEAPVSLPPADASWVRQKFDSLDAHALARIEGLPNP